MKIIGSAHVTDALMTMHLPCDSATPTLAVVGEKETIPEPHLASTIFRSACISVEQGERDSRSKNHCF